MNKQKSILITAIFSLLFGSVLYTVALNGELAQLVVLLAFAIPGYALFCYSFYRWLRAEKQQQPERDSYFATEGETEAYDYEAEALRKTITEVFKWIDAKYEVPPDSREVLVIVSGTPKKNIGLIDAYMLAEYYEDKDDWIIEEFPEWEGAEVSYWCELPKPPKKIVNEEKNENRQKQENNI